MDWRKKKGGGVVSANRYCENLACQIRGNPKKYPLVIAKSRHDFVVIQTKSVIARIAKRFVAIYFLDCFGFCKALAMTNGSGLLRCFRFA